MPKGIACKKRFHQESFTGGVFVVILGVYLIACPGVKADDVVICDPSDALVPNRVVRYERSIDPIKAGVATNPNGLIHASPTSPVRPWDGKSPAVAQAYWKCADTDANGTLDAVVAMSASEQAAVDAPALAEQARQQAFTNEVTTNDLCTASLDEVDARINAVRDGLNTDITAVSNLAQAKTVMTSMNTAYATAFRKVARCVRARARE